MITQSALREVKKLKLPPTNHQAVLQDTSNAFSNKKVSFDFSIPPKAEFLSVGEVDAKEGVMVMWVSSENPVGLQNTDRD